MINLKEFMNHIQPSTQSTKKIFSVWYFWVLICAVLLIIFTVGYFYLKLGPVDRELIEQIKNSEGDHYRVYSWNTWRGRVYAFQCGGPPDDATYSSRRDENDKCAVKCFDGGTVFYNKWGHWIGTCGAWEGDEWKNEWNCKTWMNSLKEADADYRDPDCRNI
ncbi:MAG: hypothetical protein V1668_02615 [Patescibacteria group bacterium]